MRSVSAPISSSVLPEPAFVPKERYLSSEFAAAERERLWPRTWLHAAMLDQLDEPGKFVTVLLGGTTDVLVVRGHDGKIRAFHNVCLHRGRRLMTEPCGKTKALRCAMHHWTYADDGQLSHVPDREVFGKLLDPMPKLTELACDTWFGSVWVHLGQPEQTLAEWMEPATKLLANYDIENYYLAEMSVVDMAANWKTSADAFNELYHVIGVHPGLLPFVDDSTARPELLGPHMYGTWVVGRPSARLGPQEGLSTELRNFVVDFGLDPARAGNDPNKVVDLIREALRAQGITRLTDDELVSCCNLFLFPTFSINAYAHMITLQRFRPHPTDPERSWFDYMCLKRLWPGEKRKPPEIQYCTRPGSKDVTPGPTVEEDIDAIIEVQRGMRAPGFRELRLGGHESRLLHMNSVIDHYLARPVP